VKDLRGALSARFDDFYEVQQQKVEYSRCELGYILDAEGPQFETDGVVFRDSWKLAEPAWGELL